MDPLDLARAKRSRSPGMTPSGSFPGGIHGFADDEVLVGAGAGLEFLHPAVVDFGDIEVAFLIDREAVHAPEAAGEIAPHTPRIYKVSGEIVFQHLRGAAIVGPERAVGADIDQMDVGGILAEAPFSQIFPVFIEDLDAVIAA